MSKLNARGHEILDDTPVAMPVGFNRPPTLADQIRAMVKGELSRQASEQGLETFEDADDFDVDDDMDPSSPWELNFDQESTPRVQFSLKKSSMQEQKPAKPSDDSAGKKEVVEPPKKE